MFSLLLNFSLAEMLESLKRDYSEIEKIFEALLTALENQHQTINADFDKEREQLLEALTVPVNVNDQDTWDGEKRESEREAQKQREKQVDQKVEVWRKKEVSKIKQAVTLTWIVYMRVARRCQNIKMARAIFSRARKSPLCTNHIFIASGT